MPDEQYETPDAGTPARGRDDAGSSNGKTVDFGSTDVGSTPTPAVRETEVGASVSPDDAGRKPKRRRRDPGTALHPDKETVAKRLEVVKKLRRDGYRGTRLFRKVLELQERESMARLNVHAAKNLGKQPTADDKRDAAVIWGDVPPTQRTLDAYLAKANRYFRARAQRDRDEEIGMALERLEDDRAWGIETGKRSVAVAAQKEINQVLGLHAAAKLQIGGDPDNRTPIPTEPTERATMTEDQWWREIASSLRLTRADMDAALRASQAVAGKN